MEQLDEYLSELANIYSDDKFRLLPVYEVIDRLLDIRNSIPDIIIDGDEMTKYFKGSRIQP
jgi:hypothetical protein